jgi:RHS repeat-associated protein
VVAWSPVGTSSAKPAKLQQFVTAAAEIRGELSARITELRASYDSFQASGSSYVGNPDLMDVELPGLVVNYQNDETFVAVVREAFLDAGGSANPDGLVTADTAAFDAAFVTVATAAGIDPADLLLDREAVTVDVPVAAGTPPTSGFVADPVCTATGHFLEVEEDFTWPERLAVLRWRRTYSSRFVAGGPFGRGWASWATCALVEGQDGAVGYAGPDGQMAVFVPSLAADDPPGSFARVSGVQARLQRDAVSGWALRWDRASAERGGQVWRFDAAGLIREVTDPARGTVSFAYDGGLLTTVAHEGGRALTLEWDGARVVEVRGSCGRAARYRYDDRGDLVGTERVVGDSRYEVDADGRIVEVWDADGVRLCRNTYDDEGRVLAQVSPFGREVRFRYHLGNRTVVSDTEDGPVNIYEHDRAGRLVGVVDDQGRRLSRSFDAEGRCVEASGFDGGVSRQEFSTDGLTATRTAPGISERWEYDPDGRVTTHRVEGGPTMGFEYADEGPFPSRITGPDGWHVDVETAGGLVTRMTDADGVTVHFAHDADGNVVSTTNGLGAAVTTEFHPSGLASRVVQPDGAVYEFDRDPAGRLAALRTPAGGEFTVQWTPAGRLAGLIDPDDGHTTFEHGTHGAIERIVDAIGAAVELTHDHLERLVGLAAPGGAKWDFAYGGLGVLSLVNDPSGATWGFDHDDEGRLIASTDPLGHTVRRRYDAAGRVAEVVDQTGNATHFTRDTLGRVVRRDDPDGATTTVAWDTWGRPTVVALPDGDELTYAYTPAGRMASVTTAEGRSWTTSYDAAGRLASTTDAAGNTTTFSWDLCDRMVATISPEGRTDRVAYDGAGRVVESHAAGRTVHIGYDHSGRITSARDALGAVTRYAYDPRGKLIAATDPLGNTVRIRYDERGDPTAVLDPFGGIVTTRYDAMRRPVAVTDQLGRTTHLDRDPTGRPIARRLPTGDVVAWIRDPRGLVTDVRINGRDAIVFDHDRTGRPVVVHEPARNRTFTLSWSPGGRLRSLDVDGATTTWRHDRDGYATARTTPHGTTTYRRDPTGRVAAITTDAAGHVELDRDRDGRLIALRAPGVTRTWEQDANGLTTVATETSPDGATRTASHTRDVNGRITETVGTGGTRRYRYDPGGQIVAATTPAGSWTWAYDEAGRVISETGPDGSRTYAYDAAHQLARVDGPAGTTTVDHDAAGRRTAEAGPDGTRTLTWDPLGRLTTVTTGDTPHDVDIDALGHLAAYDGTVFAWDPTTPVAELVAIGDSPVVTAAGHLVTPRPTDPEPRDPWGHPLGGADPDHVGIGAFGELDLGGLTWLRNRIYDPATRSFVAPDPLPGIPGTSVATNPYHYAGNDPVGAVDPLGLQPLSIDQYRAYREQETGTQWGNIAMVGLVAASFFVPGGPIVATLVGAGLGMAPGIIQGVTTGNWDAGAIIKGAVVGGIAGRVGFAFGGTSSTLTGALVRGGAGGAATGTVGEGYDLLPLPGSDGSFDVENVALETVIGSATGGMGHRFSGPGAPGDATFMRPNDRFALNAANRPDVDAGGYYDVIAHGSPTRIQVETPNGSVLVDHRTAARLIQSQPDYTPGTNIRLLSCSTGANPNGFAQNLANKLNVDVQAPTDTLWAFPKGNMTIGPTDTANTGTWETFTPGGNVP